MCNQTKKTTYSNKEPIVIKMYRYLQEINSKQRKCKKIRKKIQKMLDKRYFPLYNRQALKREGTKTEGT